YDFLAPCIYEGEGEMLGLAFFKSLVKEHGRRYFEPIGKALQQAGIRSFQPLNPRHAWALRHELADYGRWVMRQHLNGQEKPELPTLDPQLSDHVQSALDQFRRSPVELSGTMRKHQLKLADRQCRMAELSQRVQDTVTLLVTALWGQRQRDEAARAAAELLCQDLHRKLTGKRPSDRYFRDAGKLADLILARGFEALAGVPRTEILRPYENR